MSKTTAYYHVVFCTKAREMTIPLEHCEHLYRFLWKEIRGLNCTLLRIGGIQNHVHMLVNLNAMVPLAKLVQNCKTRSSVWLKNDERFPHFNGWSEGYFACTLAPDQRHAVIEYIKGQVAHHLGNPVDGEIENLYRHALLDYDDRDMR